MLNFNSIYQRYANTSINWLPMDTEDLFNKNLIEQKILLEKNNWVNNPFTYTFNSQGFRCKEFTNTSTAMFLGCSYTVGVGLPTDKIWAELVSKQLNMSCANLGQGGGSADTAFRLCLGWIDKIKPKIVIFLKPPGIRWELVNNQKIEFLGVNEHNLMHPSYMREYWRDDNNDYFNVQKNIFALQHLCQQRQIKFLTFDHMPKNDPDDFARDLAHSGINTHQQFANDVLEKINGTSTG